jgi:hypothetical protein
VSSSGDACRRDRLVPLPVFHTLASSLIDQPVELTHTDLFVLEQAAQRIELDRVVLAQDFGGGGEFNRIGPSGVVSEAGFAGRCDPLDVEDQRLHGGRSRPIDYRLGFFSSTKLRPARPPIDAPECLTVGQKRRYVALSLG